MFFSGSGVLFGCFVRVFYSGFLFGCFVRVFCSQDRVLYSRPGKNLLVCLGTRTKREGGGREEGGRWGGRWEEEVGGGGG